MLAGKNIRENAIATMDGPGDAMGGTSYEYINVIVLCKNCNHDHQSQNLCLEDGTCKCNKGTGKNIDKIPLSAWFGGMEKNYEWISSDGRNFDKYGFSRDLRERYDAMPSSPPSKISSWVGEIIIGLMLFGFFLASAYLTITSVISAVMSSLSNPTVLVVTAVGLLVTWGLADKIYEFYIAPIRISHHDKGLESKYKTMKSHGKPPFS